MPRKSSLRRMYPDFYRDPPEWKEAQASMRKALAVKACRATRAERVRKRFTEAVPALLEQRQIGKQTCLSGRQVEQPLEVIVPIRRQDTYTTNTPPATDAILYSVEQTPSRMDP